MRINMISKRTLTANFDYLREKNGADSFEIETSLSQLQGYLCADRASMMRELKNMRRGLMTRRGRHVTLLPGTAEQ